MGDLETGLCVAHFCLEFIVLVNLINSQQTFYMGTFKKVRPILKIRNGLSFWNIIRVKTLRPRAEKSEAGLRRIPHDIRFEAMATSGSTIGTQTMAPDDLFKIKQLV
jgi:hypothetical protein